MRSHEALHPYVSELSARVFAETPASGWVDLDGTLAFFDISGFTTLAERLARSGRTSAEHINDVVTLVFRPLIQEALRFGGDVLEFAGDAMVVLYTGADHQRRAAAAAACMFRSLQGVGPLTTPVGTVRVGMSCGMASGSQAYYLVGSTRRALVVAGLVSSAMARLENAAHRGQALISDELANALPREWIHRRRGDGIWGLRFNGILDVESPAPSLRTRPANLDTSKLLPVEFRSLADAGRRDGELKQVAMAFIRLDDTDVLLASGDPSAVHERLQMITQLIDETAAASGVCWLETQAEANAVRWILMAGAPTATERDSERLLRVIRQIADDSPLPLRIGANLGVVFVGEMGHPRRCTYTVIGAATNVAARLMSRAEPGQILAGSRLVDACAGTFETTALEPFGVKGLKVPVVAHVVGPLAAASDPAEGEDAAPETPVIGRTAELRELIGALGSRGVVDLVGDAGIGKSRLWTEARTLTAFRHWLVVRAEPHETSAPYAPIARLLRRAAGIDVRDGADAAARALARLVSARRPADAGWLPLIADAAGVQVDRTSAVDDLDDAFRADRLRIAVSDLVLAIAGPDAVIVIEDAHWLDAASRALIDTLARMLDDGVSLLVVRRREGQRSPLATVVEIGPVNDGSADELVLRDLPAHRASDAELSRIRRTAGGNPLYLIELARAAGAAARASDPLPESLERLIAARIDRLPTGGRELIRDAAVLGSTFPRSLGALVIDRAELSDAITWERELGDLVVSDGEHVRFSHDLVRVAAYEGLSLRRRRALHRRACSVIEVYRDSIPLADPLSALAFHAVGADSPPLVVKWNRPAAEAAATRGAMEIAERLLTEVVAAEGETGAAPEDRCSTQRLLATAAERAGHLEVSLAALVSASALTAGDDRARIAVDRARVLEKLGRYRSSLLVTARALAIGPPANLVGHLLLARATVRNYLGDWKECLRIARGLLKNADHLDDPRLLAQAHLLSEWCCSCLGLPDRAKHEHAAFELLTELGDSVGLGNLLLNRGVSAWREGRVEDAIADCRASSDHYRRAGDVVGAAMADNNLAEIFALQFRLDPAEELLRNAIRVTRAANYPHGEMTATSGLSRVVAWRGDTATALDLQSTALAGFRKLAADDYILDSLVRLVELHVLDGDQGAALAAADSAAATLAKLGTVPVVPATLARLRGWALQKTGREQEAIESLTQAVALATDDGFTYEVALSSLMLGQLCCDERQVELATAQLRRLGLQGRPPFGGPRLVFDSGHQPPA